MQPQPGDRYMPPKTRRVSVLVVLGVILLGWWLLYRLDRKPLTEPDAGPQPVVARGDLASEEKTAVEIFRNNSPAVVYITTIELRRNLFNLNVYEIPKGTGSGFIWDREGRIVTNYHVIEDANRVEVTLADQSVWKGVIVGVAPDKDLAVLRISAPAEKLRTLPIGESFDPVTNTYLRGESQFRNEPGTYIARGLELGGRYAPIDGLSPDSDAYVGDWIGLYTEVELARATQTPVRVLVEID